MSIDQSRFLPRSSSLRGDVQAAVPDRVASTVPMPSLDLASPISDRSLCNKDIVTQDPHSIEKRFLKNLTVFQRNTNPKKDNPLSVEKGSLSSPVLSENNEANISEKLRILDARMEVLLTVDNPENELVHLLRAYQALLLQIDSLSPSFHKDYFLCACNQQCNLIGKELENFYQLRDEVIALDAQYTALASCSNTSASEIAQIRCKYKNLYQQAEKLIVGGAIEDHCHTCYVNLWDWESQICGLTDIVQLTCLLRQGAGIQSSSEVTSGIFERLIVRTELRCPFSGVVKNLLTKEEQVTQLLKALKLLQLMEQNPDQDSTLLNQELHQIASPPIVQNAEMILRKIFLEKGKEAMLQTIFVKENFLSEQEMKAHASLLEEKMLVEVYSSNVKKYLELRQMSFRSALKLLQMRDQLRTGGLAPRDVSSIKYPEYLLYLTNDQIEHPSFITEEEQQSLQKILNQSRDPKEEVIKCRKSIQFIQDNKNIIAHVTRSDLRHLNRLCDQVASLIV